MSAAQVQSSIQVTYHEPLEPQIEIIENCESVSEISVSYFIWCLPQIKKLEYYSN